MKQVKIYGLLALIMISSMNAISQKKTDDKPVLSKQFDKTLSGINKININDNKAVKQFTDEARKWDDVFYEGLKLIHEEAERRRKEIEGKKKQYIPEPTNTQQIDKDLLPFLAGIPEPISALPQAKQAMKPSEPDNIYTRYIERIKVYRDGLAEQARQGMPDNMKDPEKMKSDAYKQAKKSEDALNNNSIVQEMGGMEKLKNMTPAQRQASAKQMLEKVKANPSAYTGQQNDPQKAFAQKMMTDATYAAKYNYMNDQQKQEEYQAFITENGFVDNSSQGDKDKRMADRDKAATSIAIEQKMMSIRKHEEELAAIVSLLQKRTDDYFTGVNAQLNKEYAQRIEALPIVEQGEAGHGKITRPVDMAYNIVLLPIGVQNALSNKEVWKRYVDITKVTISEYNELLSGFWGKSKAIDKIMSEKGLTPAAISAGIAGSLIDLTKTAEIQSNQNASWQRTYDEKVLQIYE
jgi:hypothetical protein